MFRYKKIFTKWLIQYYSSIPIPVIKLYIGSASRFLPPIVWTLPPIAINTNAIFGSARESDIS